MDPPRRSLYWFAENQHLKEFPFTKTFVVLMWWICSGTVVSTELNFFPHLDTIITKQHCFVLYTDWEGIEQKSTMHWQLCQYRQYFIQCPTFVNVQKCFLLTQIYVCEFYPFVNICLRVKVWIFRAKWQNQKYWWNIAIHLETNSKIKKIRFFYSHHLSSFKISINLQLCIFN